MQRISILSQILELQARHLIIYLKIKDKNKILKNEIYIAKTRNDKIIKKKFKK